MREKQVELLAEEIQAIVEGLSDTRGSHDRSKPYMTFEPACHAIHGNEEDLCTEVELAAYKKG